MRFSKSCLLILLLPLALIGCDSFVDIAPESDRTVEEFFETEGEFETALNGAYNALQQEGMFSQAYWVLFEMRSDNTDQGADVTGLARELFVVNEFVETTANEFVENAWTDSYDAIQRANLILHSLEAYEGDSSFEERVEGEALFLRSLVYFHLAAAYGNIPLRLEATTSVELGEETEDEQVSEEEVYAQLITDLETAQAQLPASIPSEEVGRATRGAANALLGKVALQNGDEATAQTALERVINSGEYELLDDYADLWGPENQNNAESIFEVQFQAGGVGLGSRFSNEFSPSADLQTGEGDGRNRPTEDMEEAYDEGDERFVPSMATEYVDSEGEVQEERHIKKYESDPFANYDADVNWVVLRYTDVLLMYAEALGPSSEAWNLIDEVRERAGLSEADRAGDFYEQLLQERRVELAFENQRWIDLRRFSQNYDISIEDRLASEVDNISNFTELFPIPQREVDVAGLDQNPGH